ncbi:hypothetical protein PG994_014067 [Apiospora phragmitis]|uniref:Ecp2 effector protein-like domain-containing protein n=1 Tax=Apiospora phragmitis TaxID=2905665 RepID=A0ABR1T501_9PEZI
MGLFTTVPIALLGLGLAAAEVADTGLMARFNKADTLKGMQVCKKCNKVGMTNFCDGSTFEKGNEKAKGGGAALVKECEVLRDQVKNTDQQLLYMFPMEPINAGEWNLIKVTAGNCGVSFKAGGALQGTDGLAMGTGDVFEIVRDAIAKFQKNGRVSAQGKTFCRGNGADGRFGDVEVAWRVSDPFTNLLA